jgi:hypothetical protein
MQLAIPLLCLAAVLPAATGPDPSIWLPTDSSVTIQLPDLVRSRERWATTPYPALLATAWGRVTVGELQHQLESAVIGANTAIADVSALAFSLAGGGDAPFTIGAVGRGKPDSLRPALLPLFQALPPEDGDVTLGEGRIAIHGPLVAWRSPANAALKPGPAIPVHDPAADLVASFDPHLLPGLGTVRCAISLDKTGLHETTTIAGGPVSTALIAAPLHWADPAELQALPATTMCAVTWTADAAATRRILTAAQITASHPHLLALERTAADLALPGLVETLNAANGPCTAWLAEGSPFPTATVALSLPRAVAEHWIAAASARFALATLADGSRAGFVGLLPLAIGWLDGRLIITTDPTGLDAWRQRKPGFAEFPSVRAALAQVPKRCLLLGTGRGGASWASLAQLAVPLFASLGNPHIVALPGDLKQTAGHGWLILTCDPTGTLQLDAGGLFGGPLSLATLLGIATPAVLWAQQAQQPARAAPTTPVF